MIEGIANTAGSGTNQVLAANALKAVTDEASTQAQIVNRLLVEPQQESERPEDIAARQIREGLSLDVRV